MTTQNAFHPQTAEFAAAVTRNLPRVSGEVMQGWITNPAGLQEALAHALSPKVKTSSILEFISTVKVPATSSTFISKEKFMVNTKRNAAVKISYLGDNFIIWFLSGKGKTEAPISEQTLRYHKLREASPDGPIIAELGGADKSETTLSEMFSLMEKQKNGEDGVLLNNGYANIFYIKDNAGMLRAVYVFWYDDGWGVDARFIERPHRWRDGIHVFSRQPAEALA